LNLAQIMALRKECEPEKKCNVVDRWSKSNPLDSPSLVVYKGNPNEIPELNLDGGNLVPPKTKVAPAPSPNDEPECFNGPSMITFDGDQTLYSDGANFESNPKLATYLYLLLRNGVTIAVVTAAGYEYQTAKYEMRLSGLLDFFKQKQPLLTEDQLNRFFLFGGECNYLLRLGKDYKLHPVKERGAGGWMTSTRYLGLDSPGNWPEADIKGMLNLAEKSIKASIDEQNLKARFIRKKRSVGLVPAGGSAPIPREALDETVLRIQDDLDQMIRTTHVNTPLPYCAFNGGRDVWVDVGNKRVGVQILQSYLGVPAEETLHIGDQFLNTGNDYAARQTCPCVWITSPDETTYILKSILRLAGIVPTQHMKDDDSGDGLLVENGGNGNTMERNDSNVDFAELERRRSFNAVMDVYTGEMIKTPALNLPPNQAVRKTQG
jgi:IMP and pyridine-specific 5'-nucleotidase